MKCAAATDLLVRLEECLSAADRLGWTVTGARLSQVVEMVRAEARFACAEPVTLAHGGGEQAFPASA